MQMEEIKNFIDQKTDSSAMKLNQANINNTEFSNAMKTISDSCLSIDIEYRKYLHFLNSKINASKSNAYLNENQNQIKRLGDAINKIYNIFNSERSDHKQFVDIINYLNVGPENPWQRTPRILNNDDWERSTINFISRRKRSSINDDINIQLNAFGKNINLNLQERENTLYSPTTPVYKLYSNSLLPQTVEIKGPNIERKIYEDSQNRATFVLDIFPNGWRIIQNGYIGSENLTIAADNSLWQEQSSILLNSWNTPSTNRYIFRRVQHENYPFANPIILNNYDYRVQLGYNNHVQIPSTIYIEILVIIDFELFTRIGSDQILSYVLTFWNQVDTLYRSLDQPKFKLNIAGIVLPMDPVVLEYFSQDSYGTSYSESIKYRTLVIENGKWLYKSKKILPLENYDIAVTMTPRQEQPIAVSPYEYRATLGISALNGACLINHRHGQTHSVAVIWDDGNFSGVQTAAHEIGHLLGSRHDTYPCSESDGYIMAPTSSSTENRFKWSRCTLRDFTYFLRTNPQCLFNKPRILQ